MKPNVARIRNIRPGMATRVHQDLLTENLALRRQLDARNKVNWWLQGPILLLGALAIFLVQSPETALMGCVIGLAGQPFFLRAAWLDRQYGVFLLGFVYTAVWANGLVRAL